MIRWENIQKYQMDEEFTKLPEGLPRPEFLYVMNDKENN